MIINVFIGILGESFKIQSLAILYIIIYIYIHLKGLYIIKLEIKFFVLLCLFIVNVFIGILGEIFEIQFLATCSKDFSKGLNQM